jgi:hypothetical protein
MRKGFLNSVVALAIGAGLALAQAPVPETAAPQKLVVGETKAVQPISADIPALPPAPAAAPSLGCSAEPACLQPEVCGPAGRVWASAEYLLWWFRDQNLPPLVTTGTPASGGILGSGGTLLVGASDFNSEDFSGGRFTLGAWLNDCHTVGIEGGYFFVGPRRDDIIVSSSGAPGSPLLARPFVDETGLPNAEIAAFPGVAAGTITISQRSFLQGADVNGLVNVCCSCAGRLDALAGFRYLDLDERLDVLEDVTIFPTSPILAGDHIVVADAFQTRNQFYGGQIGGRYEIIRGRIFANILGVIGFGDTHQSVNIMGSSTVTTPAGATTVASGGLLALPSNIGHYTRDEFSVVPELGLNIGYQFTDHVRAYIGYTFLYWSDVVRPADQINLNINSTMIPTSVTTPVGPARPTFSFRDTDFWAQGINFGVQVRF